MTGISKAEQRANAVHWIGDRPTSLHANGPASFEHKTRNESEVTCKLCLTLLARRDEDES